MSDLTAPLNLSLIPLKVEKLVKTTLTKKEKQTKNDVITCGDIINFIMNLDTICDILVHC